MALGEYVSVSSQPDSERAQMARERRELAEFPLDEWGELSAPYAAKGLTPTTARQIAEELTEQNALAGHLETELNIDPEDLASPAQGAGASALSFTLGAMLPSSPSCCHPTPGVCRSACWRPGAGRDVRHRPTLRHRRRLTRSTSRRTHHESGPNYVRSDMATTPLETTLLGKTDLDITRVGFGAWAIGGGGWEMGWGPQVDDDSIAAIHHALELGVNWIDTAAAYGFGHSEQVVGRALAGLPHDQRPYVFTKASLVEGPGRTIEHNLKRDSILREAEVSLRRLGLDAIDLYQIHWPIPDEDVEEGWAAFAELKEQGVVRHMGVSNFSVEQLRRAQQVAPVETIQPQYSLTDRDAEDDVLPFAEREAIGVIVYSPMASGLLTGAMTRERIARLPDDDWRKRDPRFQEPRLSHNLALVERLRAVADRHSTSPGAVAVAWALHNPAVDGAIVGFRRPDQVDPLVSAANLRLDNSDLATIEEEA
jgi:aryl-alcohol dehydrogenase-like predicted oxidoreductase